MAARYKGGETAALGDSVECGVKNCSVHRGLKTVVAIDGDRITLNDADYSHLAGDFNRVASSPEPAPSSVGEWKPIKGRPPFECKAAWVRDMNGQWELFHRPSGDWLEWDEHIPIAVPPPPPPVENVIGLPRRFRAKWKRAERETIPVTGALLAYGVYCWSDKGLWDYRHESSGINIVLTDIEFIDT